MKFSRCRTCEAPIVWTITTNGKPMPVDAEPVVAQRGFRIDEQQFDEAQQGFDDAELRPGKDVVATFTTTPERGECLYQSHFATCSYAAAHRT